MPKFWVGFIAGIIALKVFNYLRDIIKGIIIYYQMKDYIK